MSEKYKAEAFGELYFITVTVVDWVDVLTRPVYKEIVIESLRHCQKEKGLILNAFVIMSNQWHAIVSSEIIMLPDILNDLKKHTSKQIIKAIKAYNESRREWLLKKFEFAALRVKKGVNYKVWQDGFHPIHLSSNKMIEQRLEYLHQNPVEEGYVYELEDYIYSSARDYTGLPGLL